MQKWGSDIDTSLAYENISFNMHYPYTLYTFLKKSLIPSDIYLNHHKLLIDTHTYSKQRVSMSDSVVSETKVSDLWVHSKIT